MPKSVDEAGTARVSISSIGRWSDYRNALQPTFALTEVESLDAVVPTTQVVEQKNLNAFGARLATALPTLSSTSVVNTLPTGEPAADPGLTTVTRKSGDAALLKPEVTTPGSRTAATLSGFDSLATATLGKDPMLRYWSAAALYQEVQLLNRYIKDAAAREHFVPYVVRFNVGLMPRRRNLPLDTYLTLSFFVGDETRCATPASRDRPATTPTSPETCQLPEVLPLLVTDNVEAALRSQTTDDLNAFGLALAGTVNAVGVGANLDNLQEQFKRSMARNLNSLLMITRLTSNTLRVRFGAMQQTDDAYAMVPRNQFVTAVVLVPEGISSQSDSLLRRLHVWSGIEFVNVKSGDPLREKSAKRDTADVAAIAKRYMQAEASVEAAWQDVLNGDWNSYVTKFSRNPNNLREMWVDIAQLQAGYSFDVLSVELPPTRRRRFFPDQEALLVDDGRDTTTVQLAGASGMDPSNLCAALLLGNPPQRVMAKKTTLFVDSTVAQFEFPSLKAWGLDRNKDNERTLLVRMAPEAHECWDQPDRVGHSELKLATAYRLTQPESKPGFDAYVLSGVVIAKEGKGTVRLELTPTAEQPTDTVKVSLSGGDVANIRTAYRDSKKPTQVTPAEQRTTIGADFGVALKSGSVAMVSIDLENLKAGGNLKVVFASAKGEKLPVKEIPIEKSGS
jgi:hypothetical protein